MKNPTLINQSTSKWYADTVIQSLFVFPMLVCYFLAIFKSEFIIGALIIQLGVGGVQLLSGLFHALVRKSQWHTIYFVSALLYLLFLWIVLYSVGSSSSDAALFFCIGLFNCLIPVGIAIWYLNKSFHYHKNYVAPSKDTQFSYGDDELLDDVFQMES